MEDSLLRCVKCNEVVPLTPCDFSPGEQQPRVGILTITEAERRSFEKHHQGHRLDRLEVQRESYISRHPWSNPAREGFFEATDNQGRNFVIKQWRERADEPMRYEFMGHGCIEIENREIEIQKEAFKEKLGLEAKARELVISEGKVELFILFLECKLVFFRYKRFKEMVFNEHPLVVWVKLDDSLLSSMRDFVETEGMEGIFDQRESQFLKDFIENHNYPTDVLGLRIRRDFEISAFK